MREIRFRAWDEQNKKMRYGDPRDDGFYFENDGCAMQYSIWMSSNSDTNPPIMQYTGLRDRNGVRIFEGDIVKATGTYPGEGWFDTGEHDYNFTGLVKWDTDMATYILGGYRLCTLDKLVVLGNIHDNPELLEVE